MPTFMVTLLAAAPPRVGDPLAFYSAAAMVVPLIYLGIVYQARLFDPDYGTWWIMLLAPLMTVLVATAEIDALNVLSTGHPTTHDRHRIIAALLVSGMLLLIFPTATIGVEITAPLDMKRRERGKRPIFVFAGGTAVAVVILVGMFVMRMIF